MFPTGCMLQRASTHGPQIMRPLSLSKAGTFAIKHSLIVLCTIDLSKSGACADP